MGSSNENSAFGPVLNPWDRTRVPGGSSRRQRRRRRRRRSRRGRSAPTPAARSASPPRCAGSSGSSRPTARSRRYGMIAFASSLDQAGPLTRDVTDAALLLRPHGRARDPRDSTSLGHPRARSRCPSAAAPRRRCASACPERADRRGHRARRAAQRFEATLDARRASSARRVETRHAAARRRTASAPTT